MIDANTIKKNVNYYVKKFVKYNHVINHVIKNQIVVMIVQGYVMRNVLNCAKYVIKMIKLLKYILDLKMKKIQGFMNWIANMFLKFKDQINI